MATVCNALFASPLVAAYRASSDAREPVSSLCVPVSYKKLRVSSNNIRPTKILTRQCNDRRAVGMCRGSQESQTESTTSDNAHSVPKSLQPVLVVGATGGVGQLCVASLLDRGVQIVGLVVVGDTRDKHSLSCDAIQGVRSVIIATGTTAFPTKRWSGGNGPEQTDVEGTRSLLASLPPSVARVVLISSAGVTRFDQFPYNVLNLFGVLRCKKAAEEMVRASGVPFTIIRAGRLTDGPYTSYDVNTLLKATSGLRRSISIEKGDTLKGETSRLSVAEACIQALGLDVTQGQTYLINSVEGDGPGTSRAKWEALFTRC
eukprot:jgi/Mesen1/1935/ME000146S01023